MTVLARLPDPLRQLLTKRRRWWKIRHQAFADPTTGFKFWFKLTKDGPILEIVNRDRGRIAIIRFDRDGHRRGRVELHSANGAAGAEPHHLT